MRLLPLVLVVFLLPFAAHALYHWLQDGTDFRAYVRKAPLLALAATGFVLVLAVLVTFASFSGKGPGTVYHPAEMKDGKIEEGHFE